MTHARLRAPDSLTVAVLDDFWDTYQIEEGESVETGEYHACISLVTYTDDPAFFVYSDSDDALLKSGRFCPDLHSFESRHQIDRSQLTLIDPVWKSNLDRE